MILKKQVLLDKIVKKDYNNMLEQVLAKKEYQEDVKNLLLDTLYKIEASYNDYIKVKKNVLSKENYLKNIINTIYKKCDSIKFIKQSSQKASGKTFTIDKEKKEIKCYPIARKLLYAIAKMQKSDDIVRSDNWLINATLTNMLNVGNSINTLEPLRDFNGFSWHISVLEIEDLYYNLVYQNLILLTENKVLEEWININNPMVDYSELLIEELKRNYGKRATDAIIELIKRLSIDLEFTANKDVNSSLIKKAIKEKEQLKETLNLMQNEVEFLGEVFKKRKLLIRKIKKIDILLNNKALLKQEYEKKNSKLPLEKKIFSPKTYAKQLVKLRAKYMKNLNEYAYAMDYRNFIPRREKVKYDLKYFNLVEKNLEKDTWKNIILLQRQVIRCINNKIKNISEKSELIRKIYETRYYNLLPVTNNERNNDILEIEKDLTRLKNNIITKSIQIKLINSIFLKQEYNEKALKNLFLIDAISLENLYVKLEKNEGEYYITFLDEDIIEAKFKLDFDFKKEDLKIKLNKKIKLFV